VGPGDVNVARAVHDSRRVRPGDLFVALTGATADGHRFVQAALDAGAAAAVVEHDVTLPGGPSLLVVPDARTAFGIAAQALAGDPTTRLTLAGVTGTSGKTTTTYLMRSILEAAGRPTGVIGTISVIIGKRVIPSAMTTPDADDLAAYFAEMREAGLTAAVMEVSSHALDQRRTAGLHFNVAAFTNLSKEHQDYHPTMEHYRDAKGLLFSGLEPGAAAVLNADEKHTPYYRSIVPRGVRLLTYGLDNPADVRAENIRADVRGSTYVLVTPRGRAEVRSPLLGLHNIANQLTAAGMAEALTIPIETIVRGLEAVRVVPGRLEPVPTDLPFAVLVDYAHKTDALEHALSTVKDLVTGRGRLLVVFGCGGNRDQKKRPAMAAVAEHYADRVFVTNDNPRNEQPQAIADAILAGFASLAKVTVELDRRAAIGLALAEARPGDVVVIAGKGHEPYQIIGDVTRPFDDREVAADILRAATSGQRQA
jgi:UDP-N-acetylmuramoyl-L-alanyl-D-glutamate--2,6-diaminopimelate ligase